MATIYDEKTGEKITDEPFVRYMENPCICKHCGHEYNIPLPTGYCSGCLNYLEHKT
jgi:hypothetical protein